MSIHVALHHVTRYRYDRAIALGPQTIRLRPAPHNRSRILSYSLRVQPEKHFINWQQDPQSNYLARIVFPDTTQELKIEVDLVAEMTVFNPFDFFLEPEAETLPFEYAEWQRDELAPYFRTLPATPKFSDYLKTIKLDGRRTVDFLVEINRGLYDHLNYLIRLEPGVQSPEETLERQSGSCRDSSWLLVQLLRHLGFAARFVSGYLIQLTPDVKPLDGPAGPSADFTDLHAWCEVYLPGAGWVGLDPTSGMLAGEGHISLASTPDPFTAAPISGSLEECEVSFEHEMSVTRIHEAPRVTKPYSEAQWHAIESLGHAVDDELRAMDVRLTQGGEPTFVSVDDPDGAEWNTAAMGPNKKRLSSELFHRMCDRHAPQGLVHVGQGKWYPGEPLPRWSLNCFWRKDGQPIWVRRDLIGDESKPTGADTDTAARFLRAVAVRLGVGDAHVLPAYEDAYYYLWREGRLPSNVDPFDSKLEDPVERARLTRLFSAGLDTVAGHILPIARSDSGTGWLSGAWPLRRERCYLIPGDSPLGLRLPLDTLPWVTAEDYPWIHHPDPFAETGPLPARDAIDTGFAPPTGPRVTMQSPAATESVNPAGATSLTASISARGVVRTAMCAEARGGTLFVFMPPVSTLEDYLELAAAIEATAAAQSQPVILEGYEPPKDARLRSFRITPDPGVIEVNVHPVASWDELVAQTTHLYDAAHETRLTTEKFLVDGRHVGTGGGNHVVLGGDTPADSPFLRRPDLLRSLVAYWHNHPSLSYLFSGMFIGPTSQAPRVDEARNDAIFELELAFREMDRLTRAGAEGCPPWLVDRLLRNLLVDVTGNTHRAEFCIDKLYSPDSSAGRLGLLELRAFEMPPHARMSLAQQLLLRTLVARFWKAPYRPTRLARWNTELHDRFLLPHFVWQDFSDVLAEMREAGYPIQDDWFASHFEFRFPKYGDFAVRGMQLELRSALEPWHVLGEEGSAGGTVRYVDSSVERIQVRLSGAAPDRYRLTCNGVPVPLQPTGTVGEFVAGVRYRAWQPASALHPTIGVDNPLTFDLVDTWSDRSVGGCQYHVMHPGGRNFETFPVNAFEAESRRMARYFRMGHTPGAVTVGEPRINPEFPFTLDLRHY